MLHEVTFNYDTPKGGIALYLLAFGMHIFWFRKYWQGRRRRALRAKEEKEEVKKKKKGNQERDKQGRPLLATNSHEEQQQQQDEGVSTATLSSSKSGIKIEDEIGDGGYSTRSVASVSGLSTANTFQLRAKNSSAHI